MDAVVRDSAASDGVPSTVAVLLVVRTASALIAGGRFASAACSSAATAFRAASADCRAASADFRSLAATAAARICSAIFSACSAGSETPASSSCTMSLGLTLPSFTWVRSSPSVSGPPIVPSQLRNSHSPPASCSIFKATSAWTAARASRAHRCCADVGPPACPLPCSCLDRDRLRSGRSSSRWPRLSPAFLHRSGLPARPGRCLGASAVSLAWRGFCSGWGGGGGIAALLSDTLLLGRRDSGVGRGTGSPLSMGAPGSPCNGAGFAGFPEARSGRPSALRAC